MKKVVEHLFDPELKYEDEAIDSMVDLMKLCMNSLYSPSIIKNIDEENIIGSENWFLKNNDETVVEYIALPDSEIVVKYISDLGIDFIKEVDKSVASNLGIFVPSHSKRIMNKFY